MFLLTQQLSTADFADKFSRRIHDGDPLVVVVGNGVVPVGQDTDPRGPLQLARTSTTNAELESEVTLRTETLNALVVGVGNENAAIGSHCDPLGIGKLPLGPASGPDLLNEIVLDRVDPGTLTGVGSGRGRAILVWLVGVLPMLGCLVLLLPAERAQGGE